MTELSTGDKVRVKPLAAIGQVVHVSARLKRWPYLVLIPGYGERSFAADELEQLPASTVVAVPPYGMPFV